MFQIQYERTMNRWFAFSLGPWPGYQTVAVLLCSKKRGRKKNFSFIHHLKKSTAVNSSLLATLCLLGLGTPRETTINLLQSYLSLDLAIY